MANCHTIFIFYVSCYIILKHNWRVSILYADQESIITRRLTNNEARDLLQEQKFTAANWDLDENGFLSGPEQISIVRRTLERIQQGQAAPFSYTDIDAINPERLQLVFQEKVGKQLLVLEVCPSKELEALKDQFRSAMDKAIMAPSR